MDRLALQSTPANADPGDDLKAQDCSEAGLALTWGCPNANPDIPEANPKGLAGLAQMLAE